MQAGAKLSQRVIQRIEAQFLDRRGEYVAGIFAPWLGLTATGHALLSRVPNCLGQSDEVLLRVNSGPLNPMKEHQRQPDDLGLSPTLLLALLAFPVPESLGSVSLPQEVLLEHPLQAPLGFVPHRF